MSKLGRGCELSSPRRSVVVALGLVALMAMPRPTTAEESPSADEIVERALKKHSFEIESGRSEIELVVESAGGDRSSKKMTLKSAEVDDAPRTLVELTHPEDLKDQAFLFVQRPDGEDDVWMYVPAFDVTRRIEGSKKQGAFLGSHFTYADLESRDVERADYEKVGSDEIGGHPVHVVRATPESGVDSDYGSIRIYVRKSDFVPLKFVFHDDDGGEVKRLLVTKVGTAESGRKFIKQMKMKSADGGYSVVTVESIETGVDLPESIFSKQQLGK